MVLFVLLSALMLIILLLFFNGLSYFYCWFELRVSLLGVSLELLQVVNGTKLNEKLGVVIWLIL